jgi:quercetin dioxygenase-like cupin family protein
MWNQSNFETGLQYIDCVILKPNESIGIHTHGEDEEIYVILKGYGNLYSNGQNIKVKPGDVIVNSFHDTHGLENNSNIDMELFIFDVAKMEGENGITNK